MLGRSHRFHGLNSLNFAYRQGQQVRGGQLSLRYALNKRRTSYRAAVVVGKKVDKSAVVRNRIRRRIYAVLEAEGKSIDQPYDLILSVFNVQLAIISAAELQHLVADLLQKAGVTSQHKPPAHAIVNGEE